MIFCNYQELRHLDTMINQKLSVNYSAEL